MNYLKNILLITLFITKFSFGQKPVIGIKAGVAFSNVTINLLIRILTTSKLQQGLVF